MCELYGLYATHLFYHEYFCLARGVIFHALALNFQVIGAVLNSIGLGTQNASNVVGGVQPNMQVDIFFVVYLSVYR